MTRSFRLGVLLALAAVLAVPLTIVIGGLALYFLAGGTNDFVLGLLAVAGRAEPTDPPARLLWVGPTMAVLGAAGFAVLGGYFWLAATIFRQWRASDRPAGD
jgi:hypothetical protein